MNKVELIAKVAERTDNTKTTVKTVVEALVDEIANALYKGDKVQITGFGSFETKERAERTGINPQTGERMSIPAARTPVFKAGKTLKDWVKMG